MVTKLAISLLFRFLMPTIVDFPIIHLCQFYDNSLITFLTISNFVSIHKDIEAFIIRINSSLFVLLVSKKISRGQRKTQLD